MESVQYSRRCVQVSVKDYARFVESLRPNVYESLCDSASSASNMQKRIKKSVDRTVLFLDEMLELRNFSKVHLHQPGELHLELIIVGVIRHYRSVACWEQ